MTDLIDIMEGRAQRDDALARVAANAGTFMSDALTAIAALPPGEYTGEDIRILFTPQGIVPHHHNAWGALICAAVKRGLLVGTGRWVAMKSVKNHAHRSEVYRK